MVKKNTIMSEVSCIDRENEQIHKEIKSTFGILNESILENIININAIKKVLGKFINPTLLY